MWEREDLLVHFYLINNFLNKKRPAFRPGQRLGQKNRWNDSPAANNPKW